MAFLEFPHNLRSISRTKLTSRLSVLSEHDSKSVFGGLARMLMAIVILVSAGFVWYQDSQNQQLPEVLGTGEQAKDVDIFLEIERTRRILEVRPDYAAAWLRLAVLYEAAGELDLANEARTKAAGLNPDLAF